LIALRDADRFRFANNLEAWIEVDDGRITSFGPERQRQSSAAPHMRLGPKGVIFAAIPFPEIVARARGHAVVGDVHPDGRRPAGHAGATPRQQAAVRADRGPGRVGHAGADHQRRRIVGAQGRRRQPPFPRHWIYDAGLKLVEKSGTIDFKTWYRESFDQHSPWGDEQTPALVTAVETALERELSTKIMRGGAKPKIRKLSAGEILTEQGKPGNELYMLVDGVPVGRGSTVWQWPTWARAWVLGERGRARGAALRTSTLRAVTNCKVAVATAEEIDPAALAELSTGHRREEG